MTAVSKDGLLSLSHAGSIEAIRKQSGHDTSSHAFNTLYIWRRFVGNRLHLEPDMFTLLYRAKGENTWLFPCGDRQAAFRFITDHLHESAFSLCYLRAGDMEWLKENFPDRFDFEPSVGDSEYVVSRENHISLTGKKYEKLRNKVHRAEKDCRIETEHLSASNREEALEIIRDWRGNRQAIGALELYGDEEDPEPMMKMEQLGITGILMKVNGEAYGVAAGFRLSEDTYDLFLAKEKQRDPYLGYYLRRELIRTLPECIRWVNLEDDLEIEGLRTMKKQMIPEKMNEMWTAKAR